jgi:hypothetical protein
MKVIVIGGGIAGLTACYELCQLPNIQVELYDMKEELGGLAKSIKYKKGEYAGLHSEHSWRLFNSKYNNLFSILKNIKENNKPIYNNLNLGKPIQLQERKQEIFNFLYKRLSFVQLIKCIYYILLNIFAGNSRSQQILSKQKIINNLSFLDKNTIRYISEFLQYIGADPKLISQHTVNNVNKLGKTWYHLGKPTNEAIINPWVKYLQSKSVKIYKNHKLTKINLTNNKITNLIFNNKIKKSSDYYILTLPPYALFELFKQTQLTNSLKNQIKQLHYKGYHKELSFRIYSTDKINLGTYLSLPFTDWGIVIIPLHEFWFKSTSLGKGKKSLFSGTCIGGYNPSKFTNKNIFNSHLNEVKKEIKRQLENDNRFNKLLSNKNKGKTLKDFKYDIEIWEEWYDTKQGCDTDDIYWCNTFETFQYRIDQDIGLLNTTLGGVHTKTTVDLATMESAAESGKLACLKLLKKANISNNIYYYEHKFNFILRFLHKIDDILYKINFPNLFIVIIILIIINLIL